MTRYVIDAPTLLHLVAKGVQVSPKHQIVAPNLIRSQALSLLLEAVRKGDLTEEVALAHHEPRCRLIPYGRGPGPRAFSPQTGLTLSAAPPPPRSSARARLGRLRGGTAPKRAAGLPWSTKPTARTDRRNGISSRGW